MLSSAQAAEPETQKLEIQQYDVFLKPHANAVDPRTLLREIESTYPALQASLQELRAQEADVVAQNGAFDITWRTRGSADVLGYYPTQTLDTVFEKPTTLWGTRFFAGYRLGLGDFAVYDGKLATLGLGEWRAGFEIPILRDGPTDRRRVNLGKSEWALKQSQAQFQQMRGEVFRTALNRYWDWVAAGRRVVVAVTLLEIAEKRDRQLAEQVKHGDLPEFDRIDNRRILAQRQGQLAAAERLVELAQIELSLFWRKENDPVLLSPELMPSNLEQLAPKDLLQDLPAYDLGNLQRLQQETSTLWDIGLSKRPEIQRLHAQIEQNQLELGLARNSFLPRLDLQTSVSQDVGQGSQSLRPTDLKFGVLLEIPIQFRTARGRTDQEFANSLRLQTLYRFQADRVRADIQDALSAIRQSDLRVKNAVAEVDSAGKLERGETKRFNAGDSNLIFVQIREQTRADAEVRLIDAVLEYNKAIVSLLFATGELSQLGL